MSARRRSASVESLAAMRRSRVLLAVSIGCRWCAIAAGQPYEPPKPMMWLQSGRWRERLALGFDNLVADVYWMRAVVYYGGKRRERDGDAAKNYDLLYPLLDLVTSLDPHFKVAYRFGAIFLTEPYPSGPGRPDLAIALLQRGIEQRSGALGVHARTSASSITGGCSDYKQAARVVRARRRAAGAPSWLAPLAATTLAEGGDRNRRGSLWTQLLEEHRHRLDAQQRRAPAAAARRHGRDRRAQRRVGGSSTRERPPAARLAGVSAAERLRGIPLDPTGVPYRARSRDRARRPVAASRRCGRCRWKPRPPSVPPS